MKNWELKENEIDLSIIIVNFNTKDLLKNCLSSLFKNTKGIGYEVIVIDNGSSDASIKMLERDFPEIKLIKNKENLGFAKACNQGIKYAQGKYICFLNGDTIVLADSFRILVGILEKNSQIGLLGPMLLNRKGQIQISAHKRFPSLLSVFVEYTFPLEQLLIRLDDFHPHDFGRKAHHRDLKAAHLMGACLLTSKEVMQKVLGFDERFFLFLEETDLAWRLKKAGFYVHYTPKAKIIHLTRGSIKGWPAASLYYLKSLLYYFSKYHKSQRLFLSIILFLASFLSIIFLIPSFLFLFWHPSLGSKIFNYLKDYFSILKRILLKRYSSIN